jgi:C1A family cysteine protease
MKFLQGDNGYCYIPYEYMTNPNFCFDVWTIRQLASDDFGQEHWDNDDSINYYQVDEDPDDNEENGRAIKQYDNDDDLIQDTKTFAEQMLGSFISLAL